MEQWGKLLTSHQHSCEWWAPSSVPCQSWAGCTLIPRVALPVQCPAALFTNWLLAHALFKTTLMTIARSPPSKLSGITHFSFLQLKNCYWFVLVQPHNHSIHVTLCSPLSNVINIIHFFQCSFITSVYWHDLTTPYQLKISSFYYCLVPRSLTKMLNKVDPTAKS